jgi:predicted enzyme related to lactoylglutathione lyase
MTPEPAGRVEVGLLDVIQAPSADVAAAVAFYRDVLGAAVQSVSTHWASVRLANVDVGIHLRERSETAAGGAATGGWEPAFRVRDVAALRARLVAAGVAITQEFHDIPGGVKLGFADRDGNPLAAVQYGVSVADLAASGGGR